MAFERNLTPQQHYTKEMNCTKYLGHLLLRAFLSEKCFPYKQPIPLLLEFMPIVSCVPTIHHSKEAGSIFNNLLKGVESCCPLPPLSLFSWVSPVISGLPTTQNPGTSTHLHWSQSILLIYFLYWGPKLGIVLYKHFEVFSYCSKVFFT